MGTHAFEACAFDRSATSPGGRDYINCRSGLLWRLQRRQVRQDLLAVFDTLIWADVLLRLAGVI